MDRDKLDTGKSDRLKISFRDRERERERRFDRSKSDRDKLEEF